MISSASWPVSAYSAAELHHDHQRWADADLWPLTKTTTDFLRQDFYFDMLQDTSYFYFWITNKKNNFCHSLDFYDLNQSVWASLPDVVVLLMSHDEALFSVYGRSKRSNLNKKHLFELLLCVCWKHPLEGSKMFVFIIGWQTQGFHLLAISLWPPLVLLWLLLNVVL